MAGDFLHTSVLNSALRKKKNKKVSFVRGSVKSFIPAGDSDKRCTAYFSPSVPCVVNMKSSIWISLLDVSEQDQLNRNVTYLAVDFALCASVHQVTR